MFGMGTGGTPSLQPPEFWPVNFPPYGARFLCLLSHVHGYAPSHASLLVLSDKKFTGPKQAFDFSAFDNAREFTLAIQGSFFVIPENRIEGKREIK